MANRGNGAGRAIGAISAMERRLGGWIKAFRIEYIYNSLNLFTYLHLLLL